MYTKAKIYNLTLGLLLLQRRVVDPDTDLSNECKVLNTHWETAFHSTLEDLDLDSTSTEADLELLESDPNDYWAYAYKYPSDCVFLRRIKSGVTVDSRSTHIEKRIAIHEGKKVIFTNEQNAGVEYIPKDVPLSCLSANVGLCIAHKLAILSAPLAIGKGAAKLIASLKEGYVIAKAEAQEQDARENFNYRDEDTESEFVQSRME